MALGFGFRCGFLGLLHMEIVQERLEREFNLDLIASAPSVEYRVELTMNRGWVNVDNPAKFPDVGEIESIEEPWVKLGVVTPDRYIGSADGAHDRAAAAASRTWSTSTRSASTCTSSCRWPS